jgi:L-aminopeptidase/D-esterase-like protein
MAAVVVVNAVGDVVDPSTGALVAGAREADHSLELSSGTESILTGAPGDSPDAGGNTTIGVLITDARLTKVEATHLARVAHDGLARTIRPAHTPMDGDTMFAAATGTLTPDVQRALPPEQLAMLMSVMAAEVTAQAVVRAVRAAEGLRLGGLWLPAWQDRVSPGGTSPVAR